MIVWINDLFEIIWQMSLTASFVCLAVCLLRLLLKRAPKIFSYALWALVFIRLICPVALNSPVSVIPSQRQWLEWAAAVAQDPGGGESGELQSSAGEYAGSNTSESLWEEREDVGTAADAVRPGQTGSQVTATGTGTIVNGDKSWHENADTRNDAAVEIPSTTDTGVEKGSSWDLAAVLWLAGMAVVLCWQAVRAGQWKRSLGQIHPIEDGVYTAAGAAAPFVMGLIHPAIYLPERMAQEDREYVLLHERTHLRRKDYLIKMAAFGICCIHWFNPFAWLAFRLMCMDMEMSCDEAVLRHLNGHQKKAYATALLSFADRTVSGGSLAFGEPYAKKRIRNVLQYRRLAYRWMLVLTVGCLAMVGCLLTDPVDDGSLDSNGASETEESTEKETAEEDAYYAQVEAHWNSYHVGSTDPQITDKSVSWYADLNHDGQDERIVFDWGYMTPSTFAVFAVLDSEGTVLYVKDPAAVHAGAMTYYLCQVGGREYLLYYSPCISTDAGDYGFTLLELNAENEMAEVDQGYVFFILGDGEYLAKYHPEWYMDIPAMVAFAVAANGYLEHSTLLFSTDQDWLEEAIASSETGMFVMGSEENPYRQYENYKAYCYEERPTEMIPTEQELRDMLVAACEEDQIPYTLNGVDVINGPMLEEEWHDAWQQHLDSYQVGSAAPQITDKSASWYADLDHDGVDERIVFDWYFLDNATPGTFAVLESNGKVVYMNDWLGTPHAGWGTYYVCQRESKEYLLWYCPNVSTGSGNYNYELLELTSSGEMQRVEAGDTYFRADPGQYVVEAYPDYKMNIADMAEFAERINALLDTSYLLVSTDQDWMNQELNQTMNGFVLGDADDPHRQYENYRVLTDKLLTKVRPQQGAIYKLLKNWCEAEGMPYIDVESSRIWEADLTHNGQPEQLVFDWSQFDTGGTGTLSVRDDWGQEIYSVEISSDHGFSSTYYLCQWQGKDYLFYYKPYIMMGEGYNSYELFYLTAAGEKILEDADSIGFYVDFIPSIVNEYGKRVMDIPAMVSFAETVNRYVAFSYLLVCSDSEWLPMPYSEGRYFVAGSPEEPYRVSETYACFDGDEKALGQDFSGITDVAQKLKAWCESAKMPYVE